MAARAAFALLRPRAEREKVDLRLHGAGVDRTVAGPQTELVGAILGLCTEAMDALGGTGGAVTVRITEPVRGRIRIAVDGNGKARDHLELPLA